ncbi:MAG TPA: hypothetical protein VIJ48_03465 [Acidimicrobiia bacterium]
MAAGLVIMDEDGNEVALDARESDCLFSLTGGLEAATVSACPGCRCRVLAAVALVDLLDAAPPHPRSTDLVDLADEAPTLHLYVVDGASDCEHPRWLDPLFEEWLDAGVAPGPHVRR